MGTEKDKIKRMKEIIRASSMCSKNYPYVSFNNGDYCVICGHHKDSHVFAHGITDCQQCDGHNKRIIEEIEDMEETA